ncbi:2-dehydropantoate 2-reductase [Bacillus badius]|uniref:2-dehydropantoate 2-reductase n=1 Tax=Bacillus badius TaxID=1455 RepID=A0ABR5B0E3_BACBA|nr:2-dehydropantoate 2-reductase [Bacillus badius]KIL73468.1 2-dehydropantoate 2-reductase [Bacillus badius]KIL80477.1 2-dehydropantoate 2-reductase [Bacillus badius]KZR57287.1 hypothetical protein A3781_03730 [Bacillus badius]MED4716142.1 2-dehydropantoate 2-reductase [Bacillus badius]
MKVGIIGGGAVGLFFAASLSQWFPVTVFTRTQEQAHTIQTKGIKVEEAGELSVRFPEAAPMDQFSRHAMDCIFIAVKQYQLPAILERLKESSLSPALIFLQNGMSHLTVLKTLPHQHLYVAAVEHGVLKSDTADIHVRGRGQTKIAVFRGDERAISAIVEQAAPSFPFEWKADYESMLLGKMAANSVINPLTAVLRVTNGELISNPYYLKMAKTIYREFSSVFANKLSAGAWEEIVHICRKTAPNRSSMLKDIESKRPTEVDAILGYVLSQAAEKDLKLPALQALYYMIKGLEYKEAE